MRNRLCRFLQCRGLRKISTLSSDIHNLPVPKSQKSGLNRILGSFTTRCVSLKPTSDFASFNPLRHFHDANFSIIDEPRQVLGDGVDDSNGEVEPIDLWEEEEEVEPEVGDGGDGGGVVLQNCPWGEKALSIAREVVVQFGEDMEIFAFKTSPRGYIYVRLDKLSTQFGCPRIEDIESFSREYKKKLDEIGATGEIPDDLALEVSSPGADRLLRVPDDLERFRHMLMVVNYMEDSDGKCREKSGVYHLVSIEIDSGCCVWRLAEVKENRDPLAKGRPFTRKQKDFRLKLLYASIKRVTLYVNY